MTDRGTSPHHALGMAQRGTSDRTVMVHWLDAFARKRSDLHDVRRSNRRATGRRPDIHADECSAVPVDALPILRSLDCTSRDGRSDSTRPGCFSIFGCGIRWSGLLLGWFVVNVILFSLGNLMRSRYLLPTYPLLAVLLADMLMRSLQSSAFSQRRHKNNPRPDIDSNGAWTRCGRDRVAIRPTDFIGRCPFCRCHWAVVLAAFRRPALPALVAMSLTIIAAFATLEQFIKPVLITSPARASLIDCLSRSLGLSRSRLWMYGRPWSIRSGCCQAGVWSCRSFVRSQIRITCGNFRSSWDRNGSGRNWLIKQLEARRMRGTYAPPTSRRYGSGWHGRQS